VLWVPTMRQTQSLGRGGLPGQVGWARGRALTAMNETEPATAALSRHGWSEVQDQALPSEGRRSRRECTAGQRPRRASASWHRLAPLLSAGGRARPSSRRYSNFSTAALCCVGPKLLSACSEPNVQNSCTRPDPNRNFLRMILPARWGWSFHRAKTHKRHCGMLANVPFDSEVRMSGCRQCLRISESGHWCAMLAKGLGPTSEREWRSI
jgi:hypothetical protein